MITCLLFKVHLLNLVSLWREYTDIQIRANKNTPISQSVFVGRLNQLDINIDSGRKIKIRKRFYYLRARVQDINKTLVDP